MRETELIDRLGEKDKKKQRGIERGKGLNESEKEREIE